MNKRPTPITIIAWFLIAIGGISIISTTAMINNPQVIELMQKSPLPASVQYALNYIGLSIMMVSGYGMLKGFNWARLLYVIWTIISFVIGFATSPMKAMMLPGLVIFGIIVFFLYRPQATAFFLSNKTDNNA